MQNFWKPDCRLAVILAVAAVIESAHCAEHDHGRRRGAAASMEQRARLAEALMPLHAQYDPEERMIRRPFSSPGYHTTLTRGMVHPTRDSLNYVVALLDTGEEQWLRRAEGILTRVIGLQDQEPASRTYGIWSWFLEEPLDKMSPPDWNWADFCGVQLLQAALDHRDRLAPSVRALVNDAIRHAARSIQRRNVGPGYTNIAIMGTYVTLVASEVYDIADLKEYALARLRRFYDYTREQGAFTEYNSPTYTIVALKELARLRMDVTNSQARPLIEELYRLAWEEIATHYHAPTRQWAGPHNRCYSTLMKPGGWSFLSRATEGRLSFGSDTPSLDEHRVPLPCPPEFEPLFVRLNEPRELVKTFVRGDRPIVGTTYLHPLFALGSVNRGDFGNQRRSVLAYWGDSRTPSYLHVRMLHDGYDFAAGRLFSVQRGGRVLGGVRFDSKGGDRHPSLDRIKDGRIEAKDLRLRFEFGGGAANRTLETPATVQAPVTFHLGDVWISIQVPFARFGSDRPHWQAGQADGTLDLVLVTGEPRIINLNALADATVGFALQISTDGEPMPNASATVAAGQLRLDWAPLSLELPLVSKE